MIYINDPQKGKENMDRYVKFNIKCKEKLAWVELQKTYKVLEEDKNYYRIENPTSKHQFIVNKTDFLKVDKDGNLIKELEEERFEAIIRHLPGTTENWKSYDSLSYNIKSFNSLKEEPFKVDKLGWYETRDGKKVKVIDLQKKFDLGVICYSRNCILLNHVGFNGKYNPCKESPGDLIKYLGPELPKEPRKFEFESYLEECLSDYIDDYNKIKKNNVRFKITMQEIIE